MDESTASVSSVDVDSRDESTASVSSLDIGSMDADNLSTETAQAGIIDLISIIAGTIFWILDIATDIYVIYKAYTEYGTHWGHALTALLISSAMLAYGLHICTIPLDTILFTNEPHNDNDDDDDTDDDEEYLHLLLIAWTLLNNPILLLGPLGR